MRVKLDIFALITLMECKYLGKMIS